MFDELTVDPERGGEVQAHSAVLGLSAYICQLLDPLGQILFASEDELNPLEGASSSTDRGPATQGKDRCY